MNRESNIKTILLTRNEVFPQLTPGQLYKWVGEVTIDAETDELAAEGR